MNAVLPEEYLRVKSGLQIVTPRPAHILDDHMGNLARLNICLLYTSQENVGVGIVTVGVVDGSVGAHSIGHKLLPDKVLQDVYKRQSGNRQ